MIIYIRATLLALLIFPHTGEAKPVTLKCTTSTGEQAADLIVDVAAKRMTWGVRKYTIIQQNDRYISAYLNSAPDEVGGEIWVLDRVNGTYKRGSVAMLISSTAGAPERAALGATIYKGRCIAPIL